MISKLMLLEQKTLKQLIKNKSNIDISIVKNILQLDPTLKVDNIDDDTEIGKYGEWLLGKLYKKYNQLSEDNKNTIKSDLQFYDYQIRSKRIPQEYNNIYKIKSIKELNDIVKNLQQGNNPLTQDPVTVTIGNHKFKTVSGNPFELLKKQYYDDIKEGGVTKWLVFNPKTKEESIVAGYNTSWCTARDDEHNLWNTYIYEGNTAWIFLLSGKYKNDNPDKYNELVNDKLDKVCIIVERGECKNRPDDQFELKLLPEIGRFIEDRIDDNSIKLANHDIFDYYDGINDILTGIRNKNNRLYHAINFTKERQIEQFKTRPDDYYEIIKKLLENDVEIDKDIQMQQVSQNGRQIKYIINAGIKPEHDIQLQQVSQDGRQIRYIIDAGIKPEHDIQLQQVSQNGYQIRYIINAGIKPEHDIQLQQVTKDGGQIKYIINAGIKPDHDVQLQQVSQNGEYIKYIIDAGVQPEDKNEWHDIQLQQVSQYGEQIKYIINAGIKPEHDVQLQQVKQYGLQIIYILNTGIKPEHDVQLQQVTQYGEQIKYIIDAGIKPEHDVQLQQVINYLEQFRCLTESNIRPIEYDVQLQQVKQDGRQIQHIIKAGIHLHHDVQLQQVSRYGNQIKYIIDAGIRPIEQDIQLQQVKQNGYQIKYIIDAGIKPNEDVQKQQVLNEPIMISYLLYDQELFKVKDNILIQQFSKDISFLSYAVQYQRDNKINISEKIQLQQISINAKEQIREIQTYQRLNEKQQLQQVKKDPELYNILKSPYPSQTQLYKKLKGINESTGYISKLLDVN